MIQINKYDCDVPQEMVPGTYLWEFAGIPTTLPKLSPKSPLLFPQVLATILTKFRQIPGSIPKKF